jgi:hypothetical protein
VSSSILQNNAWTIYWHFLQKHLSAICAALVRNHNFSSILTVMWVAFVRSPSIRAQIIWTSIQCYQQLNTLIFDIATFGINISVDFCSGDIFSLTSELGSLIICRQGLCFKGLKHSLTTTAWICLYKRKLIVCVSLPVHEHATARRWGWGAASTTRRTAFSRGKHCSLTRHFLQVLLLTRYVGYSTTAWLPVPQS